MVVVDVLRPYHDERGNRIEYGGPERTNVKIVFKGENNVLTVEDGAKLGRLAIEFDCNNGLAHIGASSGVPAFSATIRIGEDASVIIGRNVSTTATCGISSVEGTRVVIGDDTMIASGVQLRADDGHPIFDVHSGRRVNVSRDIVVGRHVWLGLNSMLLGGARIGDGSVIGLGSVVKRRIPNNCVAAGSPAKVVRRDIAWERPHLSLVRPFYKPDATTVSRSEYWNPTRDDAADTEQAPQSVRRNAGRIGRSLARVGRVSKGVALRAVPGRRHPLVSVVVPFHDVEGYLGDAIESLTAQTLRDIEIILVDDGSTDRSSTIAKRRALTDHRITVLRQDNLGVGPAREAGIARARGEYLAFLDSDDVMPREALELLVASAEGNAAEIAVGAFRRFDSRHVWVAPWVGDVHRAPLEGTTLREHPELLRNNYPCGKIFRRGFWKEQGLHFRSDAIYEDQPLIAQMLMRAARINVLTEICYDYRARDDRSSISQRPEEIRDLQDRVEAWRLSLAALEAEKAPIEVLRGWYWTIYATHMHWYLDNDAVVDEAYWSTLRDAAQYLRSHAPEGASERVPAERRAALALLEADRREDLIDFRRRGAYSDSSQFFESASPSGLRYDFRVDVPERAATTEPPGVRLIQHVEGGRVADAPNGARIQLRGDVRFAGVPTGAEGTITISVVGVDGMILASTSPDRHPETGVYTASLDLDLQRQATFTLQITLESNGLLRREPIGHAALEWLNAGSRTYTLAGGARVELRADPNPYVPLAIEVTPAGRG